MATFPTVDLVGRHKSIAFMGDSLTHNAELSVPLHLLFPAMLTRSLRSQGYSVRHRNFGLSGNTSTAMLARITEMTQYDIPRVAFIGTAINDVSGGFASTRVNLVAMGTALLNLGVPYVVIHGHHYQNFTGIDTVALEDPAYVGLRAALLGAVADLNVLFPGSTSYFDTYAYFRGLIVAGTEIQDSASWHITSGNIHWNALGHAYMGTFVEQHLKTLDPKVLLTLR